MTTKLQGQLYYERDSDRVEEISEIIAADVEIMLAWFEKYAPDRLAELIEAIELEGDGSEPTDL